VNLRYWKHIGLIELVALVEMIELIELIELIFNQFNQFNQLNQINQFKIPNEINWIGWIDLNSLTSTWFDFIRFVPLGVHLSALVLRRPDARWSPNPPIKARKRPARALAVEGVWGHHKHTRAPFDSTPTKQHATLPGPGPGPKSIQSIEPMKYIPN
jgi:hypothetical protein